MTDEELRQLLTKLEASTSNKKDWWDKFDLVTKFVATVLLVAVGGIFTFLYTTAQDKQREAMELDRQRVYKLETVSKFMPFLAHERDKVRETAIFAVQDLLGTEVATRLALLNINPETPGTLKELGERDKGQTRQVAVAAMQQVIRSDKFSVVDALYVTDRQLLEKVPIRFGPERGELSYGSTIVSIPKGHTLGALETPSPWRLDFVEDPEKHVIIANTTTSSQSAFFDELRSRLSQLESQQMLILIHGYNVSFDDAARRLAQLSYDLNFRGVPILYSWPSAASLSEYLRDEDSAVWTALHLEEFFTNLRKTASGTSINVIAHGLGNSPLIQALQNLSTELSDPEVPFLNHVILVAPDVDATLFKSIAPTLNRVATRVTRYVSSGDKVLVLSERLHSSPRAGLGGDALVAVPQINTIDVSRADTSILGHAYYATIGTVLKDIFGVLANWPPERRPGLRKVAKDGVIYWELL